jgi:pimeloyl-ACP methyl ester carboxylesterase
MKVRQVRWTSTLTAALLLTLQACSDSSDPSPAPGAAPEVLPLVFVHGQSGSAQQFESQAMRFTSNGYPQSMLFAFEYDTSSADNPLADLDVFVDAVLARTGADQVYAVGHSRGTTVWTGYLDDPGFDGAGRVAKYVNIDGRDPEELPGGVPTIGIWGEWNTANSGYNRNDDGGDAQIGPFPEDNYYFGDKSHTEVATSAEAFAVMYEFLTGVPPQRTDVAPVSAGDPVQVAGRAMIFPQNQGYGGSMVEVWELDPVSGQRIAEVPEASFAIGDDGDFGPVSVTSGSYYEFALLRPATDNFPQDSVHHFFVEPFDHDNFFVRLLSSFPREGVAAFLPASEDSSGLLAIRQREFWGDQGGESDELYIDGLNVLTPAISPRAVGEGSGANIAVFAFDDEGDNVTDLEKGELAPFDIITFLTAADVFVPAESGGRGTVEVRLVTRGGAEKRLATPNWPSVVDRKSVMFRDDTP